MARTWLSIQVELVSRRGEDFWPRPGRIMAAARSHPFMDLADAINVAFGRWDHSHLSEFVLADQTRSSQADPDLDPPEDTVEIRTATLSRLGLGDQFAYAFDFGDCWTHLCTVGNASNRPRCTASCLDSPCPSSGGGGYPTSAGVAGGTMTRSARCHRTRMGETSHRYCRIGAGATSAALERHQDRR